jgi:hypothetical protein
LLLPLLLLLLIAVAQPAQAFGNLVPALDLASCCRSASVAVGLVAFKGFDVEHQGKTTSLGAM